MINTKTVIQVLVNISGITSVQGIKDKLQSAVGDVSIVRYSVTPTSAVLYVEAQPIEGMATFQMEVTGSLFSLINVVEDIVEKSTAEFEGTVQEAFAEKKTDEPQAAMAIIFDRDPQIDYLLTKEFKLNQISTYDGLVSISTDKGLVLIEKQCNVVIDYSTYNRGTGTVRLIQTSRSEESDVVSGIEEVNSAIPTHPGSPQHPGHAQWVKFLDSQPTNKTSQDIANLISDLDAIDNGEQYKLPERKTALLDAHAKDVAEMQKLLDVMKVDGEDKILTGKVRIDGNHAQEGFIRTDGNHAQEGFIMEKTNIIPVKNIDISNEEYTVYGIADTVTETVKYNIVLISLDAFDEFAASHNIVGWDLATPNTVQVKYMEGSNTPIEQIQKFHQMMNGLDAGWINKSESVAITSKFISELNSVIDRDLVAEFLSRVAKHNVFVRETNTKIRAALLDMENDFSSLQDDVNLIIDWETLTAHASKKERIEHRKVGVKSSNGLENDKRTVNGHKENVVRINTGLSTGDFYIPVTLLTDELREKYVLDDEAHYLEDAPDFAFYELAVNGHVMLIEKTDL